MLISRSQMADAKIKKLQSGLSAFAETKEVAEIMKKELERLNLKVHVDETKYGLWFIPIQQS